MQAIRRTIDRVWKWTGSPSGSWPVYAASVVSTVCALAARIALDPVLGVRQPFPTFFLAATLMAWFGGFRPALLALGLGLACGDYFFIVPHHSFVIVQLGDLVMSATFVVVGLVVVTLIHSMRRAAVTAAEQTRALAALNQELTRRSVALRDSEARMKGIITSATDAIITIDATQRITLFNAGSEAAFGYTAEEMIGKPLELLIPERFRTVHRRHVDDFGATGISMRPMGADRVLVGLRRNGEEFPMEARISQLEVADSKLYTVILRDVTARMRAEAERAEMLVIAERARTEAENAATTIRRMQRVADAAFADLSLDNLLQEVLLRVAETLGTETAVMLMCELDDEFGAEELRVRAVVGVGDEGEIGLRVPIGHGFCGLVAKERRVMVWNDVNPEQLASPALRHQRVVSLAGVPLLSGNRLLGVLEVGTAQPRRFRQDELELLQLAAERIALGIERTARSEAEHRARQTLEASNRAKDEFLAMLGHELRNPLSAVRNAIATASLDESRRARALEIARRQADQLGRLIDDLLDVARITQGRIPLRRERVRLAQVVEQAIESTRSFIDSRGLHLNVSLGSDPLPVEGDAARLEQVFVNLLSNAAKYSEAGGRIDVVAERRSEEAVVRVRDTGIGIAPEMLPHVWDLFTQASRALDRAQGGLGIGLTVARRLIELHDGRIEVHSDGLGTGAEFVVTLGLLPAAGEEGQPIAPAQSSPERCAHILIVEDNVDTAESLTMLLELFGHRARAVFDGLSAIDGARADVPEVMLVDIGLPGMDGYEVARRVRLDPDLKHIVLIALTGYGQDEDRQQAMAAGFDYHLVKPLNPDTLNSLVGKLAD